MNLVTGEPAVRSNSLPPADGIHSLEAPARVLARQPAGDCYAGDRQAHTEERTLWLNPERDA